MGRNFLPLKREGFLQRRDLIEDLRYIFRKREEEEQQQNKWPTFIERKRALLDEF